MSQVDTRLNFINYCFKQFYEKDDAVVPSEEGLTLDMIFRCLIKLFVFLIASSYYLLTVLPCSLVENHADALKSIP